jgi:hypothetical protein
MIVDFVYVLEGGDEATRKFMVQQRAILGGEVPYIRGEHNET